MLKESALISVTGLVELLRQSHIAAGSTRRPFDFYITAAALYLVITWVSTLLFQRAETRIHARHQEGFLMDLAFMRETFLRLLDGLPLTLNLAFTSVVLGAILAMLLALMRMSGFAALDWVSRAYVFVFRGTPLLVQIFLIYYGLGQFRPTLQEWGLWTFFREPYWCAILALTLNTGAYASEIIRGGLQAVPHSQVEAARACGMSGLLLFRRIVFPIAVRQALPAYGNEIILMVKATSLASIITMMELTGIAAETHLADLPRRRSLHRRRSDLSHAELRRHPGDLCSSNGGSRPHLRRPPAIEPRLEAAHV